MKTKTTLVAMSAPAAPTEHQSREAFIALNEAASAQKALMPLLAERLVNVDRGIKERDFTDHLALHRAIRDRVTASLEKLRATLNTPEASASIANLKRQLGAMRAFFRVICDRLREMDDAFADDEDGAGFADLIADGEIAISQALGDLEVSQSATGSAPKSRAA